MLSIIAWGESFKNTDSAIAKLLSEKLKELGHEIVDESHEIVKNSVYLDLPVRSSQAYSNSDILIQFEPPCVRPDAFRLDLLEQFGMVTLQSSLQSPSSRKFESWQIGHLDKEFASQTVSALNLKETPEVLRVGLINANKHSFYTSNNYALRYDFIKLMFQKSRKLLLAGANWDYGFFKKNLAQIKQVIFELRLNSAVELKNWRFMPIPRNKLKESYLGPVRNPDLFFSKIDICVIIENSSDYVSEKLFNAIKAGCIPVYVGPSLAHFGIPTSIAVTADRNVSDILSKIDQITSGSILDWKKEVQAWASEPRNLESFDFEKSIESLAFRIDNFLKINSSSPASHSKGYENLKFEI